MKNFFLLIIVLISFIVFSQEENKNEYANFNTHFLAGVRELLMQNPQGAILHFEQCLQLTDTVSAVNYYLARLYLQEEETELAQKYIMKALQLDPHNKWYKQFHRQIRNRQKILIREEKKRQNKKETKILSEKDVLHALNEKSLNAKDEAYYLMIKATAEKYPYYPRVQLFAAQTAFLLNKWDDAEKFLLIGLDFAITDTDLLKKYYDLLRHVYHKKANPTKARQYEKLLKDLDK